MCRKRILYRHVRATDATDLQCNVDEVSIARGGADRICEYPGGRAIRRSRSHERSQSFIQTVSRQHPVPVQRRACGIFLPWSSGFSSSRSTTTFLKAKFLSLFSIQLHYKYILCTQYHTRLNLSDTIYLSGPPTSTLNQDIQQIFTIYLPS